MVPLVFALGIMLCNQQFSLDAGAFCPALVHVRLKCNGPCCAQRAVTFLHQLI